MGELILCKVPLAATPYYIDSAGINIYSLEEISFIANKHPELLNEDLLSQDFTDWVGAELRLNALKRELDDMIAEGTSLHIFVGRLLRENGYLTEYEVKKSMDRISQLENKSEAEIRKIRADRLFAGNRFSDAIIEYTSILEDRKKLKLGNSMEGDLFYNLGASYARMFFYEEAATCFKTAYEKTRKQAALRALLISYLISGDMEAFDREKDLYLVTPDVVDEVKRAVQIANDSEKVSEFIAKIDNTTGDRASQTMAMVALYKAEYEKNSGM